MDSRGMCRDMLWLGMNNAALFDQTNLAEPSIHFNASHHTRNLAFGRQIAVSGNAVSNAVGMNRSAVTLLPCHLRQKLES
jgi:hypothetical protein